MNKFYITTSIAYTNSVPHVGFALELLQADVLARHNRLIGKDVFFLTGTDEHGKKNAEAAEEAGLTPKQFVDQIATQYQKLTSVLNISNDDFIRTTDQKRHWPGAQKFWLKIKNSGDLYKAKYEGLYCIGHEAFIKLSELKNGVCPLHGQKPQTIEEENWFFKLTKYKEQLKNILEKGEVKIYPANKTNEALGMLEGLEDISFSRSRKDLSWGIPVPDDPESTYYVWVEALSNYISAIGYSSDSEKFKKYWPADVHLIGKDILKFHAIYWPAMLLSAGLPLPKSVFVHGFITVDGEKMSKTIGNVVDPFELIKKYGIDPVRYYLLREIPSSDDGDFSYKKLEERYNGDLANNLGNLVSRVAKLIETKLEGELVFEERFLDDEVKRRVSEAGESCEKAINEFKLHEALAKIWELFAYANVYIDENKPWRPAAEIALPLAASPLCPNGTLCQKTGINIGTGTPEHFLKTMTSLVYLIINAAKMVEPFLPETAEKIFKTFGYDKNKKDLNGLEFEVTQIEALFPRI